MKQGQGKFTYHNGDVFTVSQDDDSLLERSHDKKSKDDKRCHMLISTFPDDRVHMWLATAMVQESWSRQMARSASPSSLASSVICHNQHPCETAQVRSEEYKEGKLIKFTITKEKTA